MDNSEDEKIKESEELDESSSAEASEDKEESKDKEEMSEAPADAVEEKSEDLEAKQDDSEEIEEDDLEEDSDPDVEKEDMEAPSEEVKIRGFNPNEDKDEDLVYDTPKRKSGMKKFIIWLAVIAVLALAAGWIATTVFKSGEGEVKITQDSPSPVPVVTPPPEQKLERSEWSLEVLNGSGVSGLAKKVSDQLTSLGYQVIKVGNADKQNYEKSQIFVKDSLKDKLDLVIADIKDVIKIASVAGEIEDSTASARIIIGKD